MKTAKKSGNLDLQNYFVTLSGSTVTENMQLFRRRPNAMEVLFGQLLEIDTRCIDCNSLVKTDNGLQCGITIFSFNPEKQCRSNSLIKIHQAVMENGAVFAETVGDIWNLNDLLILPTNTDWDIQLTNVVAFFDPKNKSKHSQYIEADWKNIIETDIYQSNPNIFSRTQIGIYQAICVNIDTNANTDNTAQTIQQSQNATNSTDQGKLKHISNVTAGHDKTASDDNHIDIITSDENTLDEQHKIEIKSKDDMEIEMVIKESLQPIQSMNYSHSSIVENFAAMAAMMDQIKDDEAAMMDDNIHLPSMTHITTYFSHNAYDRARSNKKKSIQANDEQQLEAHVHGAAPLRTRSVSIR